MGKKEEALMLAKQLRNNLFNSDKDLSNLLLGCKTVCRYLDILDENKWIEYERNGYTHLENNEDIDEKSLPEYRFVNFIFYSLDGQQVLPDDIKLRQVLSIHPILIGSVEFENTKQISTFSSAAIDKINRFLPNNPVYKAIVPSNQLTKIEQGIRNCISEFLDTIILKLEFGEIPEQIFETIRNEVDNKMIELCPDAINKLISIYDNLKNKNPEYYSYVASSCRRIIKDLADVLFPAKKEPTIIDEKEIRLDENRFINRIHQGLKERNNSKTTNDFNKDMLNYVMNFLISIQRYASKGDHSNFTKLDSIRCVIYTYLVLGDILHYYDI